MAPKKNKAAAPASTPLPAQGKEGKKRTPSSVFDPAAGKDVYEPEKIIGKRLAKGVTQYKGAAQEAAQGEPERPARQGSERRAQARARWGRLPRPWPDQTAGNTRPHMHALSTVRKVFFQHACMWC